MTYAVEWENELPERALGFDFLLPGRLERYVAAKEVLKSTRGKGIQEKKEKRLAAQKKMEGMPDVGARENIKKPTPELWKMAKEYLEPPDNESKTLS
jgi:hypothetical protein